MTNQVTLPEPIAAYFAADRRDSEAIARCFTQDAVVKDEGHTYTGVMAIKQWKAHTEHLGAQDGGKRRWYEDYVVRVAKVERSYTLESSHEPSQP